MTAPVRLGPYAAGLVAIFAAAVAGARTFVPADAAFADFVPAALGANVTLTGTVQVSGMLAAAATPTNAGTTTVDGFTVQLTGSFPAGAESTSTFTITRSGVPVLRPGR